MALTRAEIVSEGQLLAGRDDVATQANAWLQRWLDSVAASWPWPQLQAEFHGMALPAGERNVAFGNNNPDGGPSQRVLKILDNVWLYDDSRTFRSRIRIRHQLSNPVDAIGPATLIGRPQTARVFSNTQQLGAWLMSFEPIPDRGYILSVPYIFLPNALSTDSAVPWYPAAETMVQAVAFKVSEYHNGKDHPVTQAFQADLAGLLANDRIRYGSVGGINDVLTLSAGKFRQRDIK
jgi:hypothetical protein